MCLLYVFFNHLNITITGGRIYNGIIKSMLSAWLMSLVFRHYCQYCSTENKLALRNFCKVTKERKTERKKETRCSRTSLARTALVPWKSVQDMDCSNKVREKSRECHNHKPQPFPDPKRKRKPTNLNKHKPNKRTKSTKISSLFPKRGNRNTKRTEKHKNKMTYNKSPRRINHKPTRSKTNTGTTALERSVEQTTGGFKAPLQLANFTLGPDATLNT